MGACGLGDGERQRGAELQGRNQVGIQDLEPHLKKGCRPIQFLHPPELSLSPDMQ